MEDKSIKEPSMTNLKSSGKDISDGLRLQDDEELNDLQIHSDESSLSPFFPRNLMLTETVSESDDYSDEEGELCDSCKKKFFSARWLNCGVQTEAICRPSSSKMNEKASIKEMFSRIGKMDSGGSQQSTVKYDSEEDSFENVNKQENDGCLLGNKVISNDDLSVPNEGIAINCKRNLTARKDEISVNLTKTSTSFSSAQVKLQENCSGKNEILEKTQAESAGKNSQELTEDSQHTKFGEREDFSKNSAENEKNNFSLERQEFFFPNENSVVHEDLKIKQSLKQEEFAFTGSGLLPKDLRKVRLLAELTGSEYYNEFHKKVTHIIFQTDGELRCKRTVKYLQGLVFKIWILNISWVEDSLKAGVLLAEQDYEVNGDNICKKKFVPLQSRKSNQKIFENLEICFFGHFVKFTQDVLIKLGEECGAKIFSSPSMFMHTYKKPIIIRQNLEEDSFIDDLSSKYSAKVTNLDWFVDSICNLECLPL